MSMHSFGSPPHVAFYSQLVLIFCIADCNLYVYIQVHYTYPQFVPEIWVIIVHSLYASFLLSISHVSL